MVHTGKPSGACATCKSRKIKCDEEKPACSQCKKTLRKCPGYTDVMFRNMTAVVTKKHQKAALAKVKPKVNTSSVSRSSSTSSDASDLPVISQDASTPSIFIPDTIFSQSTQSQTPRAFSFSIRPPPWMSIQEQAVHIYFKNFDDLYGARDSHNLLLYLAPLYQASFEGSPLRVAAHATALCAVAQLPGRRNLQHEATRFYGKAIQTMALALKDPDQYKSDETLVATLLLSWYETINASDRSMQAWANHIEGATAIVRMRGASQLHNPLGLSLFRAVRTEMVINCLRSNTTPLEFPEIGGWMSDFYLGTYDYQDPVSNLMQFAVDLPGLKQQGRSLIEQGWTPSTVVEMDALIEKLIALEGNMVESSLPNKQRPQTIGYVQQLPQDIEKAETWVGPIHDYDDIYTASALNKLRACRILTAKLIIIGLTWAHPDSYLSLSEYHYAVYVEQQATDEICSSVPSHFGWGKVEKQPDNEDMIHTANLVAGYLLHWPLRVARSSPRISSHQRDWIEGQLDDIAERCGVHQASLLESKQTRLTV